MFTSVAFMAATQLQPRGFQVSAYLRARLPMQSTNPAYLAKGSKGKPTAVQQPVVGAAIVRQGGNRWQQRPPSNTCQRGSRLKLQWPRGAQRRQLCPNSCDRQDQCATLPLTAEGRRSTSSACLRARRRSCTVVMPWVKHGSSNWRVVSTTAILALLFAPRKLLAPVLAHTLR